MIHNKIHLNKQTVEAPSKAERFNAVSDEEVRLVHVARGKGFRSGEKNEQCYEIQREIDCIVDFTDVSRRELMEIATSKVYYDLKPQDEIPDRISVREWLDAETSKSGGKRGPSLSAKDAEKMMASGKSAEEILAELLAKMK